MKEYFSVKEAIENGSVFFIDPDISTQGKSGGTICPKCGIWTTLPKKLKNFRPSWINDCTNCEIKDPFQRLFHKFNSVCDEDDRKKYNEWLSELRLVLSDMKYLDFDGICERRLEELIKKLPFFQGW